MIKKVTFGLILNQQEEFMLLLNCKDNLVIVSVKNSFSKLTFFLLRLF